MDHSPAEILVEAMIASAIMAPLIYAFGFRRANRAAARRARTQRRLESQGEFFSSALEALRHPFYVIDMATHEILLANRAARETWGDPPVLAGLKCHEATHGRPEPCSGDDPCPLEIVKRTGEPAVVTHVHKRADGTERHVEIHAHPIFGEDGTPRRMIEYTIDVSERVRAEKARDSAESAVSAVITNIPIVLFALDKDGTFTLSVGAGLKAIGLAPGEVVGRSVFELYAGYPDILKSVLAAMAGRPERFQCTVGSVVFDCHFMPHPDREGNRGGVLGACLDVTERAALESQYQQAQKMESVGRLTGGVAHDFNNILTALLGYADFVRAELPEGSRAAEDLREIEKAGRSAAALTRQLLAFSRRQVLKPEPVDLGASAEGLSKMLGRLIGEDIELRILSEPGTWRALVDPGQLEQVILNLAVNARDAMPEGGLLEISARNAEMSEGDAAALPGFVPGAYALLTVRDTGTGMTPEVLGRIFEPFFTTKGRDAGTGLGLSTVYGIVKQSGGYVAVESEPGRGSLFKVYLPRTDREPAKAADAPAPRERHQGGTETILLVEDDPAARALARRILEGAGYTVLSGRQGKEGLALSKGYEGRIDLLFTDVVMPGLSGLEVAKRALAGRPGIKVLFTTGYADREIALPGNGAAPAVLLKPYLPAELLSRVRRVLGQGPVK